MKAIIPAAGLGTRFLPATKSVPKEMLPVLDRPVIQHVAEEALAAPGCDGCVVVTSLSKPLIEAYFTPDEEYSAMLRGRGKHSYADACDHAGSLAVEYLYQDEPRGLGHAVLVASEATGDEPFYVCLLYTSIKNDGIYLGECYVKEQYSIYNKYIILGKQPSGRCNPARAIPYVPDGARSAGDSAAVFSSRSMSS